MRPYATGDSWVRYLLTEPRDFAYAKWGRLRCRLGRHNRTCEGRRAHCRAAERVTISTDDLTAMQNGPGLREYLGRAGIDG